MDLDKIPLFKALSRRMTWLHERQSVLAENVANADTPNYRPRDLKEPTFGELVGRQESQLRLAATQPNHLTGSGSETSFRAEVDKNVELSPSGNGVQLEDEMLKVSSTANDYQLATTLYKQHTAMLKAVLGKGP